MLALEALRDSEGYRDAETYWRQRLPDLPPGPELPLVKAPAAVRQPRFVRRGTTLSPKTWQRLKAQAAQADLTPSGLLCAAFSEVLAYWSRHQEFSLVLTLFNRLPLHHQVDEIVGDFTSTIVLASQSDAQTFVGRARDLQRQLWDNLDHRYYSGVQVLRDLGRLRGQAGASVMPVVFTSTLVGDTARRLDPAALSFLGRPVYSISQTPQVMLDHQVSEHDNALVITWDAIEEVFPPGLLDDLFQCYQGLLDALANDPSAWKESTRERLLPAWQRDSRAAINATYAPIPDDLLHRPFARQAAAAPERIAVVARGGHLPMASSLVVQRPSPSGCVGWTFDRIRSSRWSWRRAGSRSSAVLGVLEAGAAYLPIEPAWPAERLEYLLEHGEVTVVLTQSGARSSDDLAGRRPAALRRRARRPAESGTTRSDCCLPTRRNRPGVRDLHVGLDGPAEGRDDRSPRRGQHHRWTSTSRFGVGAERPGAGALGAQLRPVGLRHLRDARARAAAIVMPDARRRRATRRAGSS